MWMIVDRYCHGTKTCNDSYSVSAVSEHLIVLCSYALYCAKQIELVADNILGHAEKGEENGMNTVVC